MIHVYVHKETASPLCIVFIDVPKRFTIVISLDMVGEPDDLNTIVYQGTGKLFIEPIIDEKPIGRKISPFDTRFQKKCFLTDRSVPATPENIRKAITWCLLNQHI